ISDRGSRHGFRGERFCGGLRGARADGGSQNGSHKMSAVPARSIAELEIERERLLRMYRKMTAIRQFEEHANDLYQRALMPGLTHLYQGEEGVAVGVCEALRADDYI